MSDQHLLYIAGMPEPFAVPEDAMSIVRLALIEGKAARWEDDDGTLTLVDFGKASAARSVPSDRRRAETAAHHEERRQQERRLIKEGW